MTITGANLLIGLSRFLGDELSVVALTASSTGTNLQMIDTALTGYGDDYFRNWWIRSIATGGSNQFLFRRCTSFAQATGILTTLEAWTSTPQSADTFQLHRFKPDNMFTALDEAAIRIYPEVAQIIYDETLTGDGITDSFDIPSAIRRGPVMILEEFPISTAPDWNLLEDPLGDDTTDYTATDTTATTVDSSSNDLIIPKYDFTCTKLATATTTNGQYDQVVANMANDITAALAAGRTMTYAVWIYCTTADRVTVLFNDDNGAVATSSLHQGKGWELLTATGNVSDANATTLTTRINITNAAGAVDLWWNRGWFYFGDAARVRDIYSRSNPKRVRRDDTTQRIYLDFVPQRGYQLRLIGRDVLSALGDTISSQVTNTMEVDAENAPILYAEAARILFLREGLSTENFPKVATRIGAATAERDRLANKWRTNLPVTARLKSPWL